MKTETLNTKKKRWSQELARWLGTEDGLFAARRLQANGMFGSLDDHQAQTAERKPETGPAPVSIWQPLLEDGNLLFERPDPGPFGDHYASRKRFQAGKENGTIRICFFGESAAAGYLYAPHLTPARLLETKLAGASGQFVEVIDLARTNERLDTLVETVAASAQLDPDVLVIYAGNNWTLLETPGISPYGPSVSDRQKVARALRESGIQGPIEKAVRKVFEKAAAALAKIGGVAKSIDARVLVVVPEVNLADWQTTQPVTWLKGKDLQKWYGLFEEAKGALENQRWEKVRDSALEMIGLDGATCPTSFRLLAAAHVGLGEPEDATRACREEIESNQYATLCCLSAPQVSTMGQELIRRSARHLGFALVDLPEVFERQTGSRLPDRRLFLDYCHLTREGMEVATAAIAEAIAGLSDGLTISVEHTSEISPPEHYELSPEAEATAQFGAAIHTAHRLLSIGDKREILTYWCRKALITAPGIAQTMWDLVDVRSASGPEVLTQAQQRNIASPYRLTFQHGWRYPYLDAELIDVIAEVLEAAEPGLRDKVEDLLVNRLAITTTPIDLIDGLRFLAEPLEQFYPELMPGPGLTERGFYRSPWPETTFCMVSDGDLGIEVGLICRQPHIRNQTELNTAVEIDINGTALTSLPGRQTWRRHVFSIPANRLKRGINYLTMRWPMPDITGEEALEETTRRLELGLEADLHPVFGEIVSLKGWVESENSSA